MAPWCRGRYGSWLFSNSGSAVVWPDSVAACAGVQKGDVILTFGDKPVATIDDLQKVLLSAHNCAISLTVWRDNAEIPLSLKL
jgi:S1-C subfamily serine protease